MIYDPAGKQPIIDTRSTVLGGQTAIQQQAKVPTSANEATQQQQPQAQNQGASGAPTTPTTTQQPQQPPKLRTAYVPPSISPDIAGAPHAGQQVIQSPNYNGGKSQAAPADAGQQDGDEDEATTGHKLPDEFKVSNYDDLIRYYENKMHEVEPLSKEELEKIRRRQRAEGIVSGVSDAVRSIANIVAAHNYAPVFTDSNASMSARARARFDREREAKDQEYFNYAMNIAKLKDADRDQAFNTWKTEHALDREDVEDKYREAKENREQAKAERDAIKAEFHNQYMLGKISAQEYAARLKEVELQYAGPLWQSKINKNNQPVRGSGGGSKGGGKAAEYWYYDENDNKVYVHSAAAAKQGAIASNTYQPIYQEVETVTDNLIGGTKVGENRRKTKRQIGYKSVPKGRKKPQEKGFASDLKL